MKSNRRASPWLWSTAIGILLISPRCLVAHSTLSSGDRGETGSPLDGGQNNSCFNCHSGTSKSGTTAVTLTGFPATWSANTPYSLTLKISPTGSRGNGFEITGENATSKQGTFTAGTNSVTLGNANFLGQKNASSAASWTFTYTTPAAGAGQICLYVVGIADTGSQQGTEYFNSFCAAEGAGQSPPTITTQPSGQTVTTGQTATFSVVATGTGDTYQWQLAPSGSSTFASISGATGANYTTPATVSGDNGSQFRVVASNGGGSVTSAAATLTVNAAALTITQQPSNATVNDGRTASFTVAASGGTGAITYQWQKAAPGTSTFSSIAGATAATYTTSLLTTADSAATFKCVVTAGTSVTSSAATLTVNAVAPSITAQPANSSVLVGQTATFAVSAAGSVPLSYQWQKAPSGSSNFANIAGATSASYTTPAAILGDNGSTFRCVVTNGAGNTTSASAALAVTASATAPSITTQPTPQSVIVGQTVTFSVGASGTAPLGYQWQSAPPASSTFAAISGATAASYTTPATTNANNGESFRCVVSNGQGSVTSNAATLTIGAQAPSITTPPANTTVASGGTATFSVIAAGTAPLGYQWQKAAPASAVFSNIAGATSATYSGVVTTADSGSGFRCVVTNTGGSVTSSAATLIVSAPSAPVITVDPLPQAVNEGQTATFSLTATGSGLTYQWLVQTAAATSFSPITGATGSSFTTLATTIATDDQSQYECQVTNSGGSVTSMPALLSVVALPPTQIPTIVQEPIDTRVVAGKSATFTVGVGNPNDPTLSYQWFRDGVLITAGGTAGTYTLPVVTSNDSGVHFSCTVTNAIGSVASAEAVLYVSTPLDAPVLSNTSGLMSLSDPLQILNAYTVPVTFYWDFQLLGPPPTSGAAAPSAAPVGTASILRVTVSRAINAAGLALIPGDYQISVYAQSPTGDTSTVTTARIVFLNGDPTSARVFPNPWRIDRHAQHQVHFENMPPRSVVKIFDLSAHWLRTLDAPSGYAQWDLKNDHGDFVASGVYFYLIESDNDVEARGRLAVIR